MSSSDKTKVFGSEDLSCVFHCLRISRKFRVESTIEQCPSGSTERWMSLREGVVQRWSLDKESTVARVVNHYKHIDAQKEYSESRGTPTPFID